METLKKYFDEKDLEFIKKAQTFFNKKLFFECSFKIMNNDKIDKRYIIGLKYNKDNLENYWKFMDVKSIKTPLNDYDVIYLGLDLSNNIKKIYFEKEGNILTGLIHCFEFKNNKINFKNYSQIIELPQEVINNLPNSLLNLISNNIGIIFKREIDNITIYHIGLNNQIDYNNDFILKLITVGFDKKYNILYHTYYVRLKESIEFENDKVN